MAVHQRRRTPTSALRVALILGANVAAVWFLWSLVHTPARAARPESAENAAVPLAATGPEIYAPKQRAAGPRAAEAETRLELLGSRIRSIVERYKQKAAVESKGRVEPGATIVAVHVRDPSNGAEFGVDATRALRPASNMKIVTTMAALTLLGSDWQFVTPIEARGTLENGRLVGDLILRASGDPLFDIEANGSVRALLAPALDELERHGLGSVSGRLVLDEGSFDRPAAPPGWPGPDQRYQEFCALSGGFSANRGCLTVSVAPTSIGAAADIAVEPAGYGLERQFSATTVAGGRLTIGFDARPGGLIVRGTIPKKSPPFVGSCPVPDPVDLFSAVLRHELQARGISIDGATVRERGTAAGNVIAELKTPLTRYLVAINQESNNAVADQVFLGTANAFQASAARAGASAVSVAALERLHVSESDFRQVDGSGLSDLNRVSARQLTALLQAVSTFDARTRATYRASLAVAGVSGTLESRMRRSASKGRIFAKTGFIDGTSALSGFAACKQGGELVFSILVNYPDFGGLNSSVWKPMEDEICDLLVGAEP